MKEGLVKYNNFFFWWKVEEGKYGTSFRRWWRFRTAYRDGVLDFYSTLILITCGFTMLYGIYKGNKKGKKYYQRERLNELTLQGL